MAIDKRSAESVTSSVTIGSGPYLARIISHQDPSYMGNLEVSLLRSRGNHLAEDTQVYIVKCASPFFGYTGFEFMGKNTPDTVEGYNDTQKSYGMWMIPPDVGVNVLVTFVDGDPAQGYWIGCVPANFANNMVPGIAGAPTSEVGATGDEKSLNATSEPLPVAEINRRLNAVEGRMPDPHKIKKAIHPIAEHFREEGLVEDDVRGVTTASARREVPSMVFGISTPGPLDRRPGAKKALVGTKDHQVTKWISRLGGSQFVMDDGDDRFQRVDTPSEAPQEYLSSIGGMKGKPTIPKDELIRLRTRTGHQILLHNSEDLIYIGNSRGTAWIELSSDGKVDIFAHDSISIHSQNDVNIRGDRDVNVEAGRNINMKATAQYKTPTNLYAPPDYHDGRNLEAGRIQLESEYNFNVLCGRDMKIQLHDNTKEKKYGNLHIKVEGDMRLAVRDPNLADGDHDDNDDKRFEPDDPRAGLHFISYKNARIETGLDEKFPYDLHIKHHGDTFITTVKGKKAGHLDITSDGHHFETSRESNETLAGGDIIETAPNIHMNGPTAATAALAVQAEVSDNVMEFPLHSNVVTDQNLDWTGTKYQAGEVDSIMKRVPMHEPWAPKEHLDPVSVRPNNTDREA